MSKTDDQPDWFLKEWASQLGKRQSSLVNELGWDKARASFIWNGKQPYRRDIVNEIAAWLEIAPYELLMPPAEALALRAFREAAQTIARAGTQPSEVEAAPGPRRIKATPAKSA